MRGSHIALLFTLRTAFPRFRGNPVSVSRACEIPVSVTYRISNSHIRVKRKPGFHENAEMRFELWISSPFAISASRRAARKCKKTHFFRRKSVSFRVFAPAPGAQNRKMHTFASGKVCLLSRKLSCKPPGLTSTPLFCCLVSRFRGSRKTGSSRSRVSEIESR